MSLIRKLRPRHKKRPNPDYLIVFCVVFLVMIGLLMLASASSNLGKLRFGDSYYYLKHQIIFGLSVGVIGFFIASSIYYRYYEKLSVILMLISVGMLLLIFTPLGLGAGGAERWLNLGPFSFQPAEILKVSIVIYLAAWISRRRERTEELWRGAVPFFIAIGAISYLLIKQPSTSSAVIFASVALIMYFVGGAKPTYVISVILLSVLAFGVLIYSSPYRWERVQTFLNPETNLQTSGYHINQTLMAIGTGGMWGTGYGQSTAKIHYLPEPIGDSIFAVIAEELGFVGAMALVSLFLLLILRTLYVAARAPDQFGKLLLVGFASLIAIQVFINIAAVSGVIPLTGAPLPFISYGGTALAVFMTIAGIINNVSRYR